MLIWEAHRDLAASLGDSCNITESVIYDGARFPKKNRDSYLYRAILEIMRQVLQSVSFLPKSRIADYINILFPTQLISLNLVLSDFTKSYEIQSNKNYITRYELDLDSNIQLNVTGNNKNPLLITSVQASELLDGNPMIIPIPLKNSLERTKAINSRIAHRPDSFAERVNNKLWIWDCYQNMNEYGSVLVTYLPYPRKPADATVPVIPKPIGSYEYTDNLDIEENMLQKMFSYALLYAMTDDQNSDNQGLISAQIQLTQNQPIQPGGE